MPLQTQLKTLCINLEETFDSIAVDRKSKLLDLSKMIYELKKKQGKAQITAICTHNSRRSQLMQLWIKTAAIFYDIKNIQAFSGGTEETCFNPRMVVAARKAGFQVIKKDDTENPKYGVHIDGNDKTEEIYFSKVYDHPANPQSGFIALLVCDQAAEACPMVVGSAHRVPLTYKDPKAYDDTPQESEKYDEKVMEIGREMLFVFSVWQKTSNFCF